MNDLMNIFAGGDATTVATSVKLLLLLTVLSLAPSILILMTCFTRVVIVLGFVSADQADWALLASLIAFQTRYGVAGMSR